jgi:hydroxypyruvate isomerase
MKYSICIETLFQEFDFEDRIPQVKKAGFEYYEFWTWQKRNIKLIKHQSALSGVKLASISGDEDFSMITPDELSPYMDLLERSVAVARELGCRCIILHSDAILPDGTAKITGQGLSEDEKMSNVRALLKIAAPIAEREKMDFFVEPLNNTIDHLGNFLDDPDQTFQLIREIGSERVKVLYDIYHMQIMRGNVIDTLEKNIDSVGYIHIADVPGRHEPGTGELNFTNILKRLDQVHYQGFIGFELYPMKNSATAIQAIRNVMI